MVKTTDEYISELQKMYPGVSWNTIKEVVDRGVGGLQDLIRRDHDIRLENLNCNFDQYRLIFYRSSNTAEGRKKRYFSNLYRLTKLREKRRNRYDTKRNS